MATAVVSGGERCLGRARVRIHGARLHAGMNVRRIVNTLVDSALTMTPTGEE